LVRLIKNTISQSLFFTQWIDVQRLISFTGRYNATLFLSISMISCILLQ